MVENKSDYMSELMWSLTLKGRIDNKQVSQVKKTDFTVGSHLEGRIIGKGLSEKTAFVLLIHERPGVPRCRKIRGRHSRQCQGRAKAQKQEGTGRV